MKYLFAIVLALSANWALVHSRCFYVTTYNGICKKLNELRNTNLEKIPDLSSCTNCYRCLKSANKNDIKALSESCGEPKYFDSQKQNCVDWPEVGTCADIPEFNCPEKEKRARRRCACKRWA